ncbi:ComF family protein [Marinobacter halodurans]|uniref:ComF family protein n=1 Tax=Marinobacter halodurans TaxID=2528979 RepID=A0ABY1ZLU2_9GAMM|nr:ComF family protein [Marinobacter halodurans]TBW56851.1 ComF family protein [Marinobacter halodurans]
MINCLTALSTFIQRKVNSWPRSGHPCITCLATTREPGLCPDCAADLPRNSLACRRCALPLVSPGVVVGDELCGRCLTSPPDFEATVAPWLYGFPVNQLISGFKFGGHRAYGRPLAEMLATELEAGIIDRPSCLIPVPMHRQRLQARGFNQAEDIALWLSDRLGIPVCTDIVRRRRETSAQSGLNRRQRLQNLRGAFEVDSSVPDHVAIVDDVMTTGATVQQMARALRRVGAARVQVWALARTPQVPEHAM